MPYKNLCDLNGKPLVEWTIRAAVESKRFFRIAVSTEDFRIRHVCSAIGIKDFLDQDEALREASVAAGGAAGSLAIAQHAARKVEECEVVALLQPTSPCRTSHDIMMAIDLFDIMNADSMISVVAHPDPASLYSMGHGGRIRPYVVGKIFIPNGAIFLVKADLLRSGHGFDVGACYAYEMPAERSIDIDVVGDLERASQVILRDRRIEESA